MKGEPCRLIDGYRQMIVLQRRVYCATLLLWVLSIVLFPTWIGQSYSRDVTGHWHVSGAFGLYGADGWYKASLLWKPPQAHTDVMGVSSPIDAPAPDVNAPQPKLARVRWPFQPMADNASVIELSWLMNSARLSLGVIVLGVCVGLWNWRTVPKVYDPVVTMAWSVSLWQVIAWPCLFFSGAWMMSEQLAAGVLSAGLLAGILLGVWSARVRNVSVPSNHRAGI